MSMIRETPLGDAMSIRDSMDRLFEDYFQRRPRNGGTSLVWQPAIEISETEDEVAVKAELPGIDPEHVDVTITAEGLTIKGKAEAEDDERGRNYYRRELRYGSFQRTVALPNEVKAEEARAVVRHGVLEVIVPKANRARPKPVAVEVQS